MPKLDQSLRYQSSREVRINDRICDSMTRRLLSTVCLVVCALISWPATPSRSAVPDAVGRPGASPCRPSRPSRHRAGRRRRAGCDCAAASVADSVELPPAAPCLDVTDAELDALQRDPRCCTSRATCRSHARHGGHQQGDGGRRRCGRGRRGCSACSDTPATRARASASPSSTPASRTHTALDARVVAHVNLVSNEPAVTGDPFGHGTHLAGIIGGNTTAAK